MRHVFISIHMTHAHPHFPTRVQVLNVLKHDSAQPLIDGGHPTPLVELDFWAAKKKNLEFMSEQLASAEVRVSHTAAIL